MLLENVTLYVIFRLMYKIYASEKPYDPGKHMFSMYFRTHVLHGFGAILIKTSLLFAL